jgi:phage host-nuclease inhibitor protein Gam
VAITEDRRHELHARLVEVLAQQRATTLMELLPPVGWADVATKRDLDHQTVVTQRDVEVAVAKLRTEMHGEFAAVRSEMQTEFTAVRTELRTEMHGEFTSVRSEIGGLRSEVAGLRTETHDAIAAAEVRFERGLRDQSRTFFLGMLGANASLAGLAFAAAQLV